MRRIGAAAVAAAAILWAAGCGNPAGTGTAKARPAGGNSAAASTAAAARPEPKFHVVKEGTPLKLAFVTNNSSDYWMIAKAGLDKAERDFGTKVDFVTPQDLDVAQQNVKLEDIASQG